MPLLLRSLFHSPWYIDSFHSGFFLLWLLKRLSEGIIYAEDKTTEQKGKLYKMLYT